MSEVVLWVDDLAGASAFYSSLLKLQLKVDAPGYRQLASADNLMHLHEVPPEYRSDSGEYATREDAAIKPVFVVESIEAAKTAVADVLRVGKSFEHDGAVMLDVIDPEGNVIQLKQPAL
jgi:predicted enzyme related to lactoylglutathione lyase